MAQAQVDARPEDAAARAALDRALTELSAAMVLRARRPR